MNKLVKNLLIISSLFLSCNAMSAPKEVMYDYIITRVIDGDTVEFEAKFLPPPLKQVLSIRVYGVDTPEKGFRAKCAEEASKGDAATKYTKELVANGKHNSITIMDWDKYGGRVLGDVIIDGKSLRESLIKSGYAREYFGDAKQSWCN